MRIAFTKMHGLGNDFVVLDGRAQALPPLTGTAVAALADRHTGIGCDQLIVIEPSAVADWRMRIFNADGGEVEACGNATRAVGLLIGGEVALETLGGTIVARPDPRGVAVMLEAEHMCMSMRGIQKAGALTLTTQFTGVFKEDPAEQVRFLTLVRNRN